MPETITAIRSGTPVGAYLREVRESRGMKLDDVAKVTRISMNYLVAIEEGMFEKLPNAAYTKGFLRLYAGVLGLSGDEIVALYDSAAAPVPPPSADPMPVKHVETIKTGGHNRWMLPLLLLSLVLMAAFFLQEKEEKKTVATPPSTPKPQAAALPSPVQPARSSSMTISAKATETAVPAVNQANSELPAAGDPRPKGVFLKLKFNQDSSLNVTIDDSVSQHYELKAGDLIEWKAENSFTLDLGNAGGVEGEFNGKTLKPFGAVGVPAHVVLKADGKQ